MINIRSIPYWQFSGRFSDTFQVSVAVDMEGEEVLQ